MNTPSNPHDMGLYAQQVRQAMAQQQTTTTTNTTAASGLTYHQIVPGGMGTTTTASTPYNVQQWPMIESLQQLAPGWRYVRWRKDEGDAEATAYSVPILALTFNKQAVSYVLGDVTPNMSPSTLTGASHFLAVLSPLDPYDETVWHEKARTAHYNWKASQIAERLLKGAPTAAPAA